MSKEERRRGYGEVRLKREGESKMRSMCGK